MTKTTVFLLLAMIGSTVAGNLLLKTGASEMATRALLQNWKLALGSVFFGASLLLYLAILSRIPLHLAQIFAASQFVLVILGAAFVLGEPIGTVRWIGIAFVATGIAVVGVSVGSDNDPPAITTTMPRAP